MPNWFDMEVFKVPGCGLFDCSQRAEDAPDTGKALVLNPVPFKAVKFTPSPECRQMVHELTLWVEGEYEFIQGLERVQMVDEFIQRLERAQFQRLEGDQRIYEFARRLERVQREYESTWWLERVQRVCMLRAVQEITESTQRNALFRTFCKSYGQPCMLIIDSGCTSNLVARKTVEKLGLKRLKHPTPYPMSWVQRGHVLLVDEQCEVEFHIDEYKEKVLCDIMPMDVCDILLGRPWQYDSDVVHYGKKNYYKVYKDGMKHKLVPIKDKETAGTSETRSQFLKQVESPKEKVTEIEPTTEKATEEEVPVSSPAEEVPAAEKTVDEIPATVEKSAEESTVTLPASEPEAESGPAESEQVEKPKEESGPAAKEAEPAKEETVKPAEAAPAEEKAEVDGKAEE